MKTALIASVTAALFLLAGAAVASAQGMMGGNGSQEQDGYYGMMAAPAQQETTAASPQTTATSSDTEAAAGAALWQKLQSGQLTCSELTEQDFAALGDYYMGEMMGPYHEQMDQYMSQSLGAQGDEQMHIALGARLSGCNTAAAYPQGTSGFFPMMVGGYGMMGGYGAQARYGMPYGGYGYWWDELFTIALWAFALIGLVASARWLMGKSNAR